MADASHTLKHDSAGFLIGNQPVNPTRSELSILQRLRDDLKAFRGLFAKKGDKGDAQQDDAPKDGGGGAGSATVTHATPRLTSAGAQTKPMAMPELGKIATPVGRTAPAIVVNVTQPVATPQRATPKRRVMDRAMPMRDDIGRFLAQAKPVKPELNRPAKQEGAAAVGTERDVTGGKVRDLLGDIKDKIGGAVDGNEEVDPNIKAAQEIAGVAGGALNGIKAVGGVLGTVATPMLRGAKGLFRPKPNDAPTPWFKRFFNELRGLRREESVFNRAQLRTLKEIEAKPGEGKGGGILGKLMMLIGPLMAAIGAALTAGFGLLMKLPGMGLLAKLATGLMPAALMGKKPITQPTAAPGGPGATAGQTGQKKPSLWERAKSKVSGWMGKSAPEAATTTAPATTAPATVAAGAAAEAAKKPGLLARAGKGAMGILKRVPLLGSLLAAVSIGSGVYASESNDTTTRAEKDKSTGKAVGGGGGAIAGMMGGGAAGAKAGALVGLIGGPIGAAIGAVIGGVVGSVAGGFFGEKAGAIVGETVGGWVTDIRNADITGMIARTWASTTDTMAKGWGETTKWFEGKWDAALKVFGDLWDKAKGVFDDLSLGATNLLAKFGIDLPDIKKKAAEALEAGKQKAQDVAGAVGGAVGAAKDKVVQGATAAVDYGKEKAGQAGEALKNSAVGRGAGWVLDQFKGGKRKAAETAQNYSAGNIAGLDDAQTRALVASTVLTESGGGKLDIVNPQGYMGRYQAGASWLSSAGLMKGGDKAVKDAMKADGFSNEWKWAESGGMTRYLSKDSNWVDGMSRSKYLASAGAQDAAFKTVNDKTYADLLKRGVIKPGDAPEVVGGYLKTAHLAGAGGAVAVSRGSQGASDANGTSARKYFDDVATDRHGFNQAFKNAGQAPVTATAAAPAIPAVPASTTVVTAGARNMPKMPSLTVEPPKVPDFQPVTAGLASTMGNGQEKRPSVIVVGNKTPVGRDLSNRPLAHIVTGGLSGS